MADNQDDEGKKQGESSTITQEDLENAEELLALKNKLLEVELELQKVANLKTLEQELEIKKAKDKKKTVEEELNDIRNRVESEKELYILETKKLDIKLKSYELEQKLGRISEEDYKQRKKEIEEELAALKKVELLIIKHLTNETAETEVKKKNLDIIQKIKKEVFGISEIQEKTSLIDIFSTFKQLGGLEKFIAIGNAFSKISAKLQSLGFDIKQQVLNLDKLITSLNAATNTIGFYNDMLFEAMSTNFRFGISGEDLVKSTSTLREVFTGFSFETKQSQEQLSIFAAKMEKAGLNSVIFADFVNLSTRSLGMSVAQAKNYTQELFAFSQANGINMKIISDGLASVMPKLAAFGGNAGKIFKELSFEAKKLGTDMATLLNISEQFTTFEGAAEAAGELNSVLGGNFVDTMELLKNSMDDPVKNIEILRNLMQQTGKTITELNGAERRMFASILKIEPDKLGALFKMTNQQIRQSQMSQEAFNDAIAAFIPIGDKLKNLIGIMAPVFGKIAEVVGSVIDKFTEIAQHPVGSKILMVIGSGLALSTTFFGLVTAAAPFILTLTSMQIKSLLAAGGVTALDSAIAGAGATAPVAGGLISRSIAGISATLTALAKPAAIAIAILAGLAAVALMFAAAYKMYKESQEIKFDVRGINTLENFDTSKLDTITDKLTAMNEQMIKLADNAKSFVSSMSGNLLVRLNTLFTQQAATTPASTSVPAATIPPIPVMIVSSTPQAQADTSRDSKTQSAENITKVEVPLQINSQLTLNESVIANAVTEKVLELKFAGDMRRLVLTQTAWASEKL